MVVKMYLKYVSNTQVGIPNEKNCTLRNISIILFIHLIDF